MTKNLFSCYIHAFLTLSFLLSFPCFSDAANTPDKGGAVSRALARMEEESRMLARAVANQAQPRNTYTYPERLEGEDSGEAETLSAEYYLVYMPMTPFVAQPGKMRIVDQAMEFGYETALGGRLPIEFTLGTRHINLNGKEPIPVTLPGKLTEIAYGMEATFPFPVFDDTYLRFDMKPTYASDDWNHDSGTFRMPMNTFLIHQPSERLILVGGISATPGYEYPVWPIIGMIYKPTDRIAFNLVPSRPNVVYSVTDHLDLFFEGDISATEFKVTKDGYKGAILRYNETHIGGGVKLNLGESLTASLSTGYMMNRYLKYRDSLGKVNLKNNAYSELRFEIGI